MLYTAEVSNHEISNNTFNKTLVSTEITEGVNKTVDLTSCTQREHKGNNLVTNASDREIHLAVRAR